MLSEVTSLDDKAVISELQSYLQTISLVDKNIPSLIPDGFYGNETRDAVSIFQRENSLPITGKVNEETWNEIYKKYLEASEKINEPLSINVFPGKEYVITRGAVGADVIMLQAMLTEISKIFWGFPKQLSDGVYNLSNENAVKLLQKSFGITPDGNVGIISWNRIVNLFNKLYPSEKGDKTG